MMQFVLDVLIRTADLALVAVGLSAVYALVKFPNIAHVQYAAAGAYLTLAGQRLGLPLWAAAAVSALLTGWLAVALHACVFRRLQRAGPGAAMIASLAVSMVLGAVLLGLAGSRQQRYALEIASPLQVGGAAVSPAQLGSVAVAGAVLAVFAAFLFLTPLGRSMRALAANRELAEATGIPAAAVTNRINFVSGLLAAIGGTMLAVRSNVHLQLGGDLLLPVFASAILGGLGNPLGAAGGALLIAFAETAFTSLDFGWLVGQPTAFAPAGYSGAASFLFLILALLYRPHGLFDRQVRRV